MKKSIKTLIPDIRARLVNTTPYDPEAVKNFGTNLVNTLVEKLASPPSKPSLRLSNLGTKCDRKLWYSINSPDIGEPLSARARLSFLFGDILEAVLLFLAEASGHKVEKTQEEVNLHGIRGHIDGLIDGELVDVKSASTFGFKKFRDHNLENDDPFGYLDQLGGYAAALGTSRGHFLAVEKEKGYVALDTYPMESPERFEKLIAEKKEMLEWPQPPARGFPDEKDGESGNRKLSVACSYCPFKRTCWPGLRVFDYSGKPRFLTVVARTPTYRGEPIRELSFHETEE